MSAKRGQRGQCKVCLHPECVRIELLLAGGAGQASVARKFGLSKDSIFRHNKDHVSAERRAHLILGPAQRQALAAQVSEEAASVLDHHRATRAALYQRLTAALEAADNNSVALLAGRLTHVNNSIAKLTGELAASPLIQNTTVNLFMNDPSFLRFMEELAAALGDYPDARRALFKRFEELERIEVGSIDAIPQLEHHRDEHAHT